MAFAESLLYGVSPWDPVTLVAVAVVVITVGLAACLIPATGRCGPIHRALCDRRDARDYRQLE
jgi:hypothetical protein